MWPSARIKCLTRWAGVSFQTGTSLRCMKVYRVKDWDQNFENNKSRERNECSFVCVPNKQDGMGFARVMAQPDGAAIYGIWNLILGACSQQRRPRQGWLTHDGHPTGSAWTPDDLALKFRRPEVEIVRAIEVLASEKVGWLETYEVIDNQAILLGAREVPGKCPPGVLEEKRREGNRIEEKEGTTPSVVGARPVPVTCPPDASEEKQRELIQRTDVTAGKDQAREVLRYLNAKSGRNFREIDVNLKLIHARLAEVSGDIDGIKKMIDRKCEQWKGDPKMDEYLRPDTLFNKIKFQSYYDLREVQTSKRHPESNQVQETISIPKL